MASEKNNSVIPGEDFDDEEDDSEEEQQQLDEEDDEVMGEENDDPLEEEEDLNSALFADHKVVTVALPPPQIATFESIPEPKRQRVEESPITAVFQQGRKQLQQPLDESRKLFQRLWTDEDEIELLQGFLDYTIQKGSLQHHHQDTALFYDQIKSKLQLDFNKNQLVEKIRRLKKKYRTVVIRIGSGKEFSFKTPHDQATYEISRKIWGNSARATVCVPGTAEDGGLDDEEINPNSHTTLLFNNNTVYNHHNHDGIDLNSIEKKTQKSKNRSRVKVEVQNVPDEKVITSTSKPASSINGLVEETVRSCLSPLLKELVNNAVNGPYSSVTRGSGGGMFSPIPLNFGGSSSFAGKLMCEIVDEKWKKQQILELEVYSKRLELVQEQIKATLEELKSTGS